MGWARRVTVAVAVGLVAVAAGLLVASGAITVDDPPDLLRSRLILLAAIAGLIAAGIAVAEAAARIPVGVAILAVTALVVVGGNAGVLAFYDSGGLGLALGIACLVALWLLVAGRRSRPTWSRDLPRRALAYLTVGLVGIPVAFSVGSEHACTGTDDELCGLGWAVIGIPAMCLGWLLAVVAAEVAAAVRRR